MQSTRQVLSTKSEILKSQVLSTRKPLTNLEIQERALYIAGTLAEPNWTAWYCKAFKLLGEHRYTAVASMAKSGTTPKTLFGWLLKQEMKKLQPTS